MKGYKFIAWTLVQLSGERLINIFLDKEPDIFFFQKIWNLYTDHKCRALIFGSNKLDLNLACKHRTDISPVDMTTLVQTYAIVYANVYFYK